MADLKSDMKETKVMISSLVKVQLNTLGHEVLKLITNLKVVSRPV